MLHLFTSKPKYPKERIVRDPALMRAHNEIFGIPGERFSQFKEILPSRKGIQVVYDKKPVVVLTDALCKHFFEFMDIRAPT
jgi:hypothetical protein